MSKPMAHSIVRVVVASAVLLSISANSTSSAPVAQRDEAPPPASSPVGAKTITIAPGQDWSLTSAQVPPGSVIELSIGVHATAVLEGLEGTPEAPIRIVGGRSSDGRATALVVGGEAGLVLRRCRHVEIDGLVVIGPTRAAVRIDGCEDLGLRNLLLARLGPDADADGVEISGSRRVEIRSARIDGWSDAAIDLRDSQAISLSGIELLAMEGRRNAVGLRVGRGVSGVQLDRFSFRGLPLAIAIGPNDALSPPAAVAKDVRIREGLVLGAGIGIELGDVADSSVSRITLRDCREAIVVSGSPSEVLFDGNIVAWDPGRMSAFGRVATGADASGLRLGENLWWSAELPAAMPLLGSIPGTATKPQRHEPAPNLDDRGVANHPGAASIGRPAP